MYEARMTKTSVAAPYGFDFIDHVHGIVPPHLIGHIKVSECATPLFYRHDTFTREGGKNQNQIGVRPVWFFD